MVGVPGGEASQTDEDCLTREPRRPGHHPTCMHFFALDSRGVSKSPVELGEEAPLARTRLFLKMRQTPFSIHARMDARVPTLCVLARLSITLPALLRVSQAADTEGQGIFPFRSTWKMPTKGRAAIVGS